MADWPPAAPDSLTYGGSVASLGTLCLLMSVRAGDRLQGYMCKSMLAVVHAKARSDPKENAL